MTHPDIYVYILRCCLPLLPKRVKNNCTPTFRQLFFEHSFCILFIQRSWLGNFWVLPNRVRNYSTIFCPIQMSVKKRIFEWRRTLVHFFLGNFTDWHPDDDTERRMRAANSRTFFRQLHRLTSWQKHSLPLGSVYIMLHLTDWRTDKHRMHEINLKYYTYYFELE